MTSALPTAPPTCPAVVAAATALLAQCRDLIKSVPQSVYARDSRALAGGTIGKHVRHVLDHYVAVVNGAECGNVIDYDRRERNVPMEVDPEQAIVTMDHVLAKLIGTKLCDPDMALRIRVMVAADGTEVELGTTFARELAFATHHAVHHQAMIAAISREFGCAVDERFGKAPSTLHHEQFLPTA